MKPSKGIVGIILAGGEGKRLRPLTSGIPKPLLPVDGTPIIDYVINNVMSCSGLERIYVGVSYKAYTIKDYLADRFRDSRVPIEAVATLGWETAGDLKQIMISKDMENNPVIVAYGDNLTQIDIGDMMRFHHETNALSTLALFKVPWEDTNRFGIAEVEEGIVTNFIEKPEQRPKSNLANAGYYIIEPIMFKEIPARKTRVEYTLFPELIKHRKLAGYVYEPKYWYDIGTNEAYRTANRKKVLEGVIPPGKDHSK